MPQRTHPVRGLRRLDPRAPFHWERQRGGSAWWSVAVASYALAWRLLATGLVLLVLVWVVEPGAASWRLLGLVALPSAAPAVLGAVCSWGDYLKDEPFRWWGPWVVLRAAPPGFAHAFGLRRESAP